MDRLNPADADAHFQLGTLLRQLGRLGEALVSFRNVVRFSPDRADALKAIGGALEEYAKAKAVFYIERATRLREKILAARDRKV